MSNWITEQEDPYITLRRYDIVISPKVEAILRQLGFSSLSAINEIDLNITLLEDDVRKFLASDENLEQLNEEQRKVIFGELFYKTPTAFKFLPGERYSIIGAVKMARKLLEKFKENYVYERPVPSRKRPASKEDNRQTPHASTPFQCQERKKL